MNGWVDVRKDGLMEGWMDGRMDGCLVGQTDDWRTYGQWVDGWLDGENGLMDGRMVGSIDR